MTLNPTRIEWRRDGWSVVMDEDGVHLRTDRSLEQCDFQEASDIFEAAKAMRAADSISCPKPPNADEIHRFAYESQRNYVARKVIAAVKEATR